MAKFTVFFNGECINTFELDEPVMFIGRLPENAISIANMGVSRRHAKIEEDADRQYVITDLNSLNGTYVNGKRIKKSNLNNGDKITIGKYTITYEEFTDRRYNEINIEPSQAAFVPPVEERMYSPTVVNQDAVAEDSFSETIDEQSQHQIPQSDLHNENTFLSSIPDDSIDENDNDADAAVDVIDEPDTDNDIDKSLRPGYGESVLIETNKHVVYKLDKAFITMGNGDNDDIFVSGFMIGEGQVSIEKHQDGYIICANKFIGKFKVNNKPTKYHLLQHKDRIEIGSSTFRYMENG